MGCFVCVRVFFFGGERWRIVFEGREKNESKWWLSVAMKWISKKSIWNDSRFIQYFASLYSTPFNPKLSSFPFFQQTHTNQRKIQLNLPRTQYFLLDPIRFLQNRVIQERVEGCIRSSSHQRWRIRHKRRWKCAFCWLLDCRDICRRILQGRW